MSNQIVGWSDIFCQETAEVLYLLTCFVPLFSKLVETVVTDTLKLLENKFDDLLVDFDSHLDNVRLDWTNSDINRALPSGGAS